MNINRCSSSKEHEAPLASIILPTHNGTRYLVQSIESCLNQTHRDLELIIVDDCSTDGTPRIIAKFDDPRILSLRHAQNRGLPHALNTGFSHARGQFLTWTSDDNWYHSDAILLMLQTLRENPRKGMVYTDYWEVDAKGDITNLCIVGEPEHLLAAPENRIGPSFLYRREVIQAVGSYDPRWRLVEDYDYWLRVGRCFEIVALHQPLYYYRYHKATLTSGTSHFAVQRKALRLALHHAVLSRSAYIQRIGDSRVDEAFFCYSHSQRWPVITNLVAGLMLQPGHARNLGVWSILLESMFGERLVRWLRQACVR